MSQQYAAPPPAYGADPSSQPKGVADPTQVVVVTTQPAPMMAAQGFQHVSTRAMCPHCSAEVMTAIRYEAGTKVYIAAVILCIIGCDAGCCLIPFCMDSCKDVVHECPNCRQTLGVWKN